MSPARRARGYPFETLPDHLRAGLDLVFVGINPGLYSVARGHYFARTTSRFWPAFSRSRLGAPITAALGVPALEPAHDRRLLDFGIGFTDVVKRPSANAADLSPRDFDLWAPRLLARLRRYRPRVACFHGLTAYRPFLRIAFRGDDRAAALGPQETRIGTTRLFVVPNPSPANAHFTVHDQAAWYDRLAAFVEADRTGAS